MTAVAWLITNKASGESHLDFKPLADMPFNRSRFTWEPLFMAAMPLAPQALENGRAGLADAHSKSPSRPAMPKEEDTHG